MTQRQPRILAFAGSTRRDSLNRRLLKVAAERVREAGGEVTAVELSDYPMPLYDGDMEAEAGLPEAARKLKRLALDHDAFLIATPEYNSSFTPLLKNTIDWMSRREEGDPAPLAAYRGKVAAIMGASNGRLGGLRSLFHLRQVLSNIQVLVIPEQLALYGAGQQLTEEGGIADEAMSGTLDRLSQRLVKVTAGLIEG